MDLLKGTEASTKNIFGRYSSQRMKVSMAKDWERAGGDIHGLSSLTGEQVKMPDLSLSLKLYQGGPVLWASVS